jgi:hypothetical protein
MSLTPIFFKKARWMSCPGARTLKLGIETEVFAITLGDAQMITTPGELFPEVFYGVERNRRSDCPAANTGRPYEPSVRDRMTRKYKFVLGLCPDELGYLVPGYDFLTPQVDPAVPTSRQAEDACQTQGVPSHYHETNSASSKLAAAWACAAARLLDGVSLTRLPVAMRRSTCIENPAAGLDEMTRSIPPFEGVKNPIVPLTCLSGTLSPKGGEGQGEGAIGFALQSVSSHLPFKGGMLTADALSS